MRSGSMSDLVGKPKLPSKVMLAVDTSKESFVAGRMKAQEGSLRELGWMEVALVLQMQVLLELVH